MTHKVAVIGLLLMAVMLIAFAPIARAGPIDFGQAYAATIDDAATNIDIMVAALPGLAVVDQEPAIIQHMINMLDVPASHNLSTAHVAAYLITSERTRSPQSYPLLC